VLEVRKLGRLAFGGQLALRVQHGDERVRRPGRSLLRHLRPHVETQEHCNAFVYYYPKLSDATCF
jgi:hypothetical protein